MVPSSTPSYPYLESGRTGYGTAALALVYSTSGALRIYGDGSHFGGDRVDPATIEPRLKPRVQDAAARLMAEGRLDREAGERFLDELFSLWPRRVAA